MPIAVVNGATLQCTCGSATSTLTVTSQTKVRAGSQLAATVMDNTTANIPPFGTCSVTSAACALAPAGPWTPGSNSVVRIGSQLALLSTDTLQCTASGQISITDPGQQPVSDT